MIQIQKMTSKIGIKYCWTIFNNYSNLNSVLGMNADAEVRYSASARGNRYFLENNLI